MLLQFSEDLFGYVLEGLEDAAAGDGTPLERGDVAGVEERIHAVQRCNV